ncbi:hypothetical protein V5P93_001695 [Actinokineospora auranticolor]|nr:hypothetical protein [Actinokineospora auranticolor]
MYFVYRSHYAGSLSKAVRRLPDPTVLAWFRRGWAAEDPEAWVEEELGTDVYGLTSIFDAAREAGLPLPETTDELRESLHEHLYVEGDDDYIRLDDHSLRVRTDDDEVELAYFFFDDNAVAAAPERLAYLLHESWPLPHGIAASQSFVPDVPVTVATPAAKGKATTFAVFLTFLDGESLARQEPLAFPGVDLLGLARHLRDADVPDDTWPPELHVLRALIAPEDETIDPALERCNRWPGFNLNEEPWLAPVDHPKALELLDSPEFVDGRDPAKSLLRVDPHLAQFAMHCNESFGYQQWFLFDSTWAAAHPALANSLLRYSHHWDPLD